MPEYTPTSDFLQSMPELIAGVPAEKVAKLDEKAGESFVFVVDPDKLGAFKKLTEELAARENGASAPRISDLQLMGVGSNAFVFNGSVNGIPSTENGEQYAVIRLVPVEDFNNFETPDHAMTLLHMHRERVTVDGHDFWLTVVPYQGVIPDYRAVEQAVHTYSHDNQVPYLVDLGTTQQFNLLRRPNGDIFTAPDSSDPLIVLADRGSHQPTQKEIGADSKHATAHLLERLYDEEGLTPQPLSAERAKVILKATAEAQLDLLAAGVKRFGLTQERIIGAAMGVNLQSGIPRDPHLISGELLVDLAVKHDLSPRYAKSLVDNIPLSAEQLDKLQAKYGELAPPTTQDDPSVSPAKPKNLEVK